MTNLMLTARPVTRLINGNRHTPAWDIYVGSMARPSFALYSDRFGWAVQAIDAKDYQDRELACMMSGTCMRSVTLRDALAEIRKVMEWQYEQDRQEAEAERETERRAEAFWENRMSDEDRAREDWEYANLS